MSMLVSFVLSFFPRDVLDEILNLIGSVSEGFPSYSYSLIDKNRCFIYLYTGGLFNCYMLDESICHFRGVGSILSLLLYFDGKSCQQTM